MRKNEGIPNTATGVPVQKKYVVQLSEPERQDLLAMLRKGKSPARTLNRAHILLLTHEGKTDADIAASLHLGASTVERTRRKFVEENLEHALTDQKRTGMRPMLDDKQEAFLIALACAAPPVERIRWTMQLLADRLVELAVVERISDETVRRTLKKLPQALAKAAMVHPRGQ